MIAALLLAVLANPPAVDARLVLMPVAEHEALVGELSRELGLSTVRLRELKLELGGCEAKLSARSVTPPTIVTVEPPKQEGGWTGLEVLGVASLVAAAALALGFGAGLVVAQ